MPDQWNALLKGSKITPEDAAKNPQAVLEALEFYTEQTRREKSAYETSDTTNKNNTSNNDYNRKNWEEEKKLSNPKPSQSTPAPRHIREAPSRPTETQPIAPALPKADLNLVKGMDKDVQVMMEKLKLQQQQQVNEITDNKKKLIEDVSWGHVVFRIIYLLKNSLLFYYYY